MASSIFVWPGLFSYNGTTIVFTTHVAFPDGTVALPSMTFVNNTALGFSRDASNNAGLLDSGGAGVAGWNGGGFALVNGNNLAFSNTDISQKDVFLVRDAANTLALRNGTNPQEFRDYAYLSGSRKAYGSVQCAVSAVTLSGATSTASNIVPAGVFVIGVATTTTTTITGATGYTVGDGSDVDRWGDITGVAVGTHSANVDATANPTGWFAAANSVVLTAKGSNFTGGVAQVAVFYHTTTAA